MLTRDTMRGLYALPPTPFTREGEFWEEAFRRNVQTLIAAGVDAVVTPGSNGEWWSEDPNQRRRHLEVLAAECQGRVTSIACTSSTYTEDSLAWTRIAEELGLDAVMNVPPFYYPLAREELRRYWHTLAESCPDIGLVIYNFSLVAQQCPTDLYIQLAEEIPALCGSKESHRDFDLWMNLHHATDMQTFSAYDRGFYTACYQQGARGMFSTLVAALPGLVKQLDAACQNQDWNAAMALESEVRGLATFLEGRDYLAPYNPIARNKALVNACGHLTAGWCREPLISVPDALVTQLRKDLETQIPTWLAPAEQMLTA